MKTTSSAFGIHRSSLLCDLPLQVGGIPKSDVCCNYIFSIKWVFQGTQASGLFYSVVCSTFAEVWLFGITQYPHAVVPSILVQTPLKRFHANQQIVTAPGWVFSNTVVCFLYLSLCFELWMWLHLSKKPSSQFQQAYDCSMSVVYLLSLINHTCAFLQPFLVCDTAISVSTHGLLRYT